MTSASSICGAREILVENDIIGIIEYVLLATSEFNDQINKNNKENKDSFRIGQQTAHDLRFCSISFVRELYVQCQRVIYLVDTMRGEFHSQNV